MATRRQPGSADTDAVDWGQGMACIDNQFVPIGEARIPILDWGFLHSDATYDVAHVWHGAFFRLEDHLDRFLQNVERLRMTLPVDRAGVRRILMECVRRSGLRDAYVEMICTRGVPPGGSRDPRQARNRFYAFAIPFVWIAEPDQWERGLHVSVSSVIRIPPGAVDPTVKNYHWLDFVRGLFDAYARGGETTVLVDGLGNVVEGPGFNVFAMHEGRLVTPDQGMLRGITRQTAIEIADEFHLPWEARALPVEQFRDASEAFVTSTAGGVIPVTRIDGRALGDGREGPVTRRIRHRYWDLHGDPRYATPAADLRSRRAPRKAVTGAGASDGDLR